MTQETLVKIGDKFIGGHDLSYKMIAVTNSFLFKPNNESEEIEYVVVKKTYPTGGNTIDLRRVSDLTKQKEIKALDWD